MRGGLSDGQTNGIKFIPFVCLSQVRVAGRMSCAGGSSAGQTNMIKFIPFVCLSQVRVNRLPVDDDDDDDDDDD